MIQIRIILKSVIGIVSLLSILYGGWKIYQYFWYQQFIPQKIKVTYPIHIGDQLAGLTEGCGAAIYRLSDYSTDEITNQNLNFFDSNWKETPIQKETLPVMNFGLDCSNASDTLLDKIDRSTNRNGSYYTYDRESVLIIIPEFKLAVFSYFG